jgi:hypothetical protein
VPGKEHLIGRRNRDWGFVVVGSDEHRAGRHGKQWLDVDGSEQQRARRDGKQWLGIDGCVWRIRDTRERHV